MSGAGAPGVVRDAPPKAEDVSATRDGGHAVTVRRARIDDAAAYARIMANPGVFPGLMQMPYAHESMWRERIAELSVDGKQDLLLVAELAGDVVGTAGLHPVHGGPRRRHAMVLGISVAPESQRRGVGTALMAAMCNYADRWVGALRLELTVYADNVAALALYRKFGFAVEGTLRGYALRDGGFVDALAMARLHPAPPRIDPAPSA